MAGERIATHSAFAKYHQYVYYKYYTKVDAGSGNKYWYGCGHSAYFWGKSRSQAFVNNDFNLYVYYRTSNSGSWHLSASTSIKEGQSKTIYSPASHSHYLRWRFRLYIGGDHKAYLGLYFRTRSMYYVNNSGHPKGRAYKVGVLRAYGTNPTYSTGTKVTKNHFIIIK